MVSQIGASCPLCGEEFARRRHYDIVEDYDPVLDLQAEIELQSVSLVTHIGLQCGHAFPQDLFDEYVDMVETHDRCVKFLDRKSGLLHDSVEHYYEDVVKLALEEIQWECINNSVAVEPEEDPYLTDRSMNQERQL